MGSGLCEFLTAPLGVFCGREITGGFLDLAVMGSIVKGDLINGPPARKQAIAFISHAVYSQIMRRFVYTQFGKYEGVLRYEFAVAAGLRPRLVKVSFNVPAGEWIVVGFTATFFGGYSQAAHAW
jgi:hypothetical protein